MLYAEKSYAGPDAWGRTFHATHYWHIAAWKEHERVKAKKEKMK